MNNDSDVSQTPYVSFVTFKKLIDGLKKDNVPARFDSSFWGTKYSGTGISHLKKAMFFFNFIDEDDHATDLLIELVSFIPLHRKNKFKELLLEKYKNKLENLNLTNATYNQLEEKFEGTSLMKQKRVAFFIKAAQECDLPLSNYILEKSKRKGRPKGTTTKRHQTVKPDPVKARFVVPDQNVQNSNITDNLLRISANGEPYSSLKFDALENFSEKEIEYLAGWLEDQSSSLRRYLKLKKAEE